MIGVGSTLVDGRFRIEGSLGTGSMGVVLRAWDAELESEVALKTVRAPSQSEFAFLREEFRVVRTVHHPNLVPPWELFADGPLHFFTMPVVEGAPVDAWVAEQGPPGSRERLDAVRRVLPGILEGLQRLHEAGVAHGDLKPTNVIVDGDRARLLDFGLSHRVDDPTWAIGGTYVFMAPEILEKGVAANAQTDVFALCVMLRECLLGEDVPLAADDDPSDPAWRAAREVLLRGGDHRPHERPSLQELAAGFGVDLSEAASKAAFVGRAEELACLGAAFEEAERGGPVVAVLRGPSGIGKSTLARHFTASTRPAAVVLEGVFDPREALPFGGVAASMDALSRSLALMPWMLDGVEPADLVAAAELFPALASVMEATPALPVRDPDERRLRAMLALRRVLAGISARAPLVVLIDDVHRASRDALDVLGFLAGDATPSRVLWVLTSRESRTIDAWADGLEAPVHRIDVGPLSEEDVVRLWRHRAGAPPPADAFASTRGHPFVATILARRAAEGDAPITDPERAILASLARLDPAARRLVEVASVARSGLPRPALLEAAGLPARARPLSFQLEHEGWLTSHDAQGELLEPSHARIADAVARALDADAQRRAHAALHDALCRRDVPPGQLYEHAVGAGNGQARRHALDAAVQAETGLAFTQAALWYERALAAGDPDAPDVVDLWRRRGLALVYAGRSGDAARAYEAGADIAAWRGAPSDEVLDLRLSAATHYVRSGRIAEGDRIFVDVLASVGERLPDTGSGAQLEGVRHRLALLWSWRPRRSGTPTADERRRLRVLRQAAFAYGISLYLRADALNLRYLRLALRCGSRPDIAYAYGQEASVEVATGFGMFVRRGEAMLRLGLELADGDPLVVAQLTGGETSAAWSHGAWARCVELAEVAEARFERAGRGIGFELLILHTFAGSAAWWSGRLDELLPRVDAWRDEARVLSDELQDVTLRVGEFSGVELVRDRPEQALEHARAACRQWPDDQVTTQRYMRLHGYVDACLYRQDPQAALAELTAEWPAMQRVGFPILAQTGSILAFAKGRTALALAVAEPARRRAWLREVRAAVRLLRGRTRNTAAPAFAALLEAGLAALVGGPAAAEAGARAAAACRAAGMPMHAEAAEAVAGDPAGLDALRARGVVDPARFAGMILPVAAGVRALAG